MTPEPFPAPGSLTPAEAVFAQYLADLELAHAPDFEACCRAHPELATTLRELKAEWERPPLSAHLAGLGPKQRGALADELRSRFGDVDPGVSLGGDEPSADSGPSSELLKRLRAHAPANSRYRMLGEVGRGGMGAVLRIWDEDLRRTLAMKVVLGKDDTAKPGDTPPVDAKTLGRFLEEAQITGQLDHPGIVPVHELGLGADGRVYFTMRLVKGEDLRKVFDHVRTGHDGWNPTRALTVLLKVCEAMSYAHDKGVIHRDLKPANIMVGKYGEVYVMDWGLARVAGQTDRHDVRVKPQPASSASVRTERREERDDTSDSPLVTMDGDVVGTPAYMAPEQARGDLPALGPHSDVYAVGALLYHLLTGEAPYMPRDVRAHNYAVWQRVKEGPPRPLIELAPRAPAELVSICEKAMERDVARRYRDMPALASDLRAYLEQRVVKAYEQGTWAETKKWVQRNKPLAAAVSAGVLVLVAGIVVVSIIGGKLTIKDKVLAAKDKQLTAKDAELAIKDSETSNLNNEATRLRDEARVRERESRMLGLIPELALLETLDDDVYTYARNQEEPASKWWLERARVLVDGVTEGPSHREISSPSLREVETELAHVRARARELTTDEVAQDRAGHPRAREFADLEAKTAWYERRLTGAAPPPVEGVLLRLMKSDWPTTAEAFNTAAWKRVDPDAPGPGSEWEGLLLARNAVRLASDAQRPLFRDTLAWALFRTGQFDEALAEERRAVTEEAALVSHASTPHVHDGEASLLDSNAAKSGSTQDAAAQPDGANPAAEPRELKLPASLARLETEVASWAATNRAARVAEFEALRRETAELDHLLDENVTWRFTESKDSWWHSELVKLVDGLRRLKTQREFAAQSVQAAEAADAWQVAIDDISMSKRYSGTRWPGGARLTPQLGLVPIGKDPDSGLWEFAHLATGNQAQRGTDGKLAIEPDTGLVLVLLPGGRVPVAANSNQQTELTKIDLDPFFISKYEMTEPQWNRIGGWHGDASEREASLLPATDFSWDDAMLTLSRTGWLSLPTEAQWEYACRAGTSTAWWPGDDVEKLRGVANISFDRNSPSRVVAILGRRANDFGLHDVHGNVWEWCRDAYGGDAEEFRREGDGLHHEANAARRVYRGGACWSGAESARSSRRNGLTPVDRSDGSGLRPARGITP